MRAAKRRHYCRRSADTFFHSALVILGRIRNHMLVRSRFGLDMHAAKTPTYLVMCRLALLIALCDHSPPTLQTDRQTDGRHARTHCDATYTVDLCFCIAFKFNACVVFNALF